VPDLDLENFNARNDRLGSANPRQTEIDAVLGDFETAAPADTADAFEALTLLVTDAILDQDDYSLRLIMDGTHRLLAMRDGAEADVAAATAQGQLIALHDVASMVLERIVPLAILAELEPDTVAHRFLAAVADNRGCSNDDLAITLELDKTAVSRAGRRLHVAGLARKRRAGRRNVWEPTPRGLAALGAIQSGGRMRPRRRQKV
jgi:hypothetical protein